MKAIPRSLDYQVYVLPGQDLPKILMEFSAKKNFSVETALVDTSEKPYGLSSSKSSKAILEPAKEYEVEEILQNVEAVGDQETPEKINQSDSEDIPYQKKVLILVSFVLAIVILRIALKLLA